nr:hypothetical protein [uncultured Azospirillum sp.]
MSNIETSIETTAKPWWQSRTMIGAGIAMGSGIASLAGFHIPVELQGQMTDIVVTAGSVVGGAVAVWGRLKATTAITR